MNRWLGRCLLVATLAMVAATALPRGGGGGGGGHGGRGGGFHGGFGGGYHGGYSGGAGGRSGGNVDPATGARIVGGIWLGLGALVTIGLAASRRQVVEVVLSMRNGEKYVPMLDDILRRADFSSPGDRAIALRKMAAMVQPGDLDDGAVMVHPGPGAGYASPASVAENRCAQQMERAGVRADAEMQLPPAGSQQIRPGDHCVLGVIFTTTDFRHYQPGGEESLGQALGAMGAAVPDPSNAVYTYYAPDPGQELDADRAREIMRKLTVEREEAQPQRGKMTPVVWVAMLVTLLPAAGLLWYSFNL